MGGENREIIEVAWAKHSGISVCQAFALGEALGNSHVEWLALDDVPRTMMQPPSAVVTAVLLFWCRWEQTFYRDLTLNALHDLSG